MSLTRTFSALAHPHLLRLWAAQVLSAVGDRLFEIAAVWLSVKLVGSEAGYVLTAGAVSRLAVGLLGGVLADRYDRRRLLVVADLVRCAAILTLPLVALSGPITLIHLALIAAVSGGLSALFEPTLQASLPALTLDSRTLQAFNGLLDGTARLARIIGPGLAGLLIALIPLEHFFTLDAATFGLSALAVLSLGRSYAWRPTLGEQSVGGLRAISNEMRSAVQLIGQHRPLSWALWSLLLVNLAWSAAFTVGLALLTERAFGGSLGLYGALVAAYGVGNVLSNLVVGGLEINNRVACFFWGKIVLGVGFFLLAVSPTIPLALFASALAAVGGPMSDIVVLLMIQEDMPKSQIGKVYSARMVLSSIGSSLGLVLAGPLFTLLPVRSGVALCAGLVLLLGVVDLIRFRRVGV